MNEQAIRLIKKFEKNVLERYRCPAGYPTIGWGHRLKSSEPWTSLTSGEADLLLRQDVHQCERVLARLINVPLESHQEAALLSFIYNIGAGAFQRSMLRMKVNREDHKEVPLEFSRWVWANGQKWRGLMVRRDIEARCYAGEPI